MKLVRNYYKQFLIRGLVAMGFGPIVLSVVYLILSITGIVENIAVTEVCLGFLTIELLAFLAGGITVVYQIDELPISQAITLHGIVLYVAYAVVYIVNGWLAKGIIPLVVFTAIFVVGYALVWTIIYFVTKRQTKKANIQLKNRAE